MAILNDTTGTLMACAWKNHNTHIGVIIGRSFHGHFGSSLVLPAGDGVMGLSLCLFVISGSLSRKLGIYLDVICVNDPLHAL